MATAVQSKNLLTQLVAALAITMALPSNAPAGLLDVLEPAQLKQKIKDAIENLEIDADADLLDLDVADILNFKAQYGYAVEPSFVNKGFLRTDAWKFRAKLTPGDFLQDIGAPVYINIEQGAEVRFIRQFKSQMKALSAIPVFDPRKIPWNADLALKHLLPGEFVSMPIKMNLVVGAQAFAQWEVVRASGSTHVGINAVFTLQVLRVDQKHLRLRLLAERGNSAGIDGKVKIEPTFVGISIVNDAIKEIIDLEVLKLSLAVNRGSVFLADYVFDLEDPQARQAYDSILASSYKLKFLKHLNPVTKTEKFVDGLIGHLELAENLFKEDSQLAPENRRVHRLFMGVNRYLGTVRKFKIGTDLVELKTEKNYLRNKIRYTAEDGQQINYYFPTFGRYSEQSALWDLYRRSENRNVGILFSADADFKDFTFSDFVNEYTFKDTLLRPSEVEAVRTRFESTFPKIVLEAFRPTFEHVVGRQEKASIRVQVVFNRGAYESLQGKTLDQLKADWKEYSKRIVMPDLALSPKLAETMPKNMLDLYKPFIKKMLEKFAIAFDSTGKVSESDRVSALIALRDNSAFDRFGTGFLLSLLSDEQLKKYVYIGIIYSSHSLDEPLAVNFGEAQQTEFYQNLLRIRAALAEEDLGLKRK